MRLWMRNQDRIRVGEIVSFLSHETAIQRDRTHWMVARLTIGKEDGADDFREMDAAVGTGDGMCAAGDTCGMSAGASSRAR